MWVGGGVLAPDKHQQRLRASQVVSGLFRSSQIFLDPVGGGFTQTHKQPPGPEGAVEPFVANTNLLQLVGEAIKDEASGARAHPNDHRGSLTGFVAS